VAEPDKIGDELRRCVQELRFVGALIDNHANGIYYDSADYSSLWEVAQELDVPIYLHPVMPTKALMETMYKGNYSSAAALSIGTFGFAWHSDVAVHILRLFSAGVFDRFPKIKVIIGHFGETLPFMLERIIHLSPAWSSNLERPFKTVWDENIWITTSGIWGISPMACILRNTKIDKILFSVDFPFETNKSGRRYLEELQKSGLVTDEQLAMIAYKNAQNLLHVGI
jgi:predicted TIM-barrel fold metal-dependent hydrolase